MTATPTRSTANRWDALKCLALALMFVDHAGAFIWTDQIWLRAIGRSAMPIFLFLVGYSLSHRSRRDLWLWGLALGVWFMAITGRWHSLNILIAIALSRALLGEIKKRGIRMQQPDLWIIFMFIIYLPSSLIVEYGSHGLMFAQMGALLRDETFSQQVKRRYTIAAFVTYALLQGISFKMGAGDIALMLAGLMLTAALLWHFRNLPLRPSVFNRAIAFIGRHSLVIYVMHLALLIWLFPNSHRL